MGFQLVSIFYFPLQIGVSFYILYTYIGISFLVGIGTMIVMMVITLIITRISTKENDKLLVAKDARMKTTEEFLNIIKFVKINALEKYFFQKINKKR
jgi:ABC-type bacteriocin/lantibiotic exporter with double-glycine peptidase domain